MGTSRVSPCSVSALGVADSAHKDQSSVKNALAVISARCLQERRDPPCHMGVGWHKPRRQPKETDPSPNSKDNCINEAGRKRENSSERNLGFELIVYFLETVLKCFEEEQQRF